MPVKKIISMLLLFLIVTHGVYQIIIFKALQAVYQNEIAEKIENGPAEEELFVFKYNLKAGFIDADWIEDDEFSYEQKMYDVVKSEVNGDSIILYCVRDENESVLYALMEKVFNGIDRKNIEESEKLAIYFSPFYFLPDVFENKYTPVLNNSYNFKIPVQLLDGEYSSVSPPPRA